MASERVALKQLLDDCVVRATVLGHEIAKANAKVKELEACREEVFDMKDRIEHHLREQKQAEGEGGGR